MNRTQMLAAGLILAAGLTVGQVLFGSGSEAEAQTRASTIDLRDVELHGAHIQFQADGGCSMRAEYVYRAPVGELAVAAQASEYFFNGPRCGVARTAAANAAARDLKFTDAGSP